MSDAFCDSVLSALQGCLPSDKKPISLHEPYFAGNEWAYVKDCLDTNWVSSVGKYVDLYEKNLAEFTGVNRAIAVVNGTAALHICLKLTGVSQGDEVLVPSLTFVATANAVTYCNAIPHFVDSEETTLGIDPAKLSNYLSEHTEVRRDGCFNNQTGHRIKAVIAVHTFGQPVDLDPLVELCSRFKLELIEDAAESLGSYYKNRHTGSFGRLSSLSFNGNKIVTTGGGGAILTNDKALAEKAKHITSTARVPHKWEISHNMVGYNYRLPNINAALGCAQIEKLPEFLTRKRALAERYSKAFKNIEGIRFFIEPAFSKSNYWLNILLVDSVKAHLRDALLDAANANGFMTRPAWTLMHKLPMFKDCPRMDLSMAENLEARIINIPSSASL